MPSAMLRELFILLILDVMIANLPDCVDRVNESAMMALA